MSAGEEPDLFGSIDAETIVAARPDFAWVELDGEIVLYDDGTHRLHRLNPTASTLWRCLDGSATLREVANDIADVYEVEVMTVVPQVVSLARSFASEGLLEGFKADSDESSEAANKRSTVAQGPFVEEDPSPSID